MADIFLVRHGETAWNRELRFQGQIDVPLNDLGLTQAQRLADRLQVEWQSGFDKPLRLFSSDLQRAHQTAQTLGQALGLAVTAHAPLREQHFGLFEGLLGDRPLLRGSFRRAPPALERQFLFGRHEVLARPRPLIFANLPGARPFRRVLAALSGQLLLRALLGELPGAR